MQSIKSDLEEQISQKQAIISEVRSNILLQWTSHLFSSHHRCILTTIAASEPLPMAEIEKFKNGTNLLSDLVDGLLVTVVRRERGVQVRINTEFFTLLPTLIEKIGSSIDPTISRLQLFGSRNDLRMCRGCRTLRSLQEIEFIGQSCNCDLPEFEPVAGDPVKLAQLTKVRGMLDTVLKCHSSIAQLNAEIQRLAVQLDRLNRRQMSQYQQFVRRYKLTTGGKVDLQADPEEVKRVAFEQLRKMMHLGKVQQIAGVRALRESQRGRSSSHGHSDLQGEGVFCYEPLPIRRGWQEEYRLQELKREATQFRRQFQRKRREMCVEFMKVEEEFDRLSQATEASS